MMAFSVRLERTGPDRNSDVYIKSLEIENLRCFSHTELQFQYPGRSDSIANGAGTPALLRPNVNLLLGSNGAGKTSVLRAIALATLAPVIEGAGYVPFKLVRRTKDAVTHIAVMRAEVVLHGQDVGTDERGAVSEHSLGAEVRRIHDSERIRSTDDAPINGVANLWEAMYDNSSPAFLIVAYGANRRVESARSFDSSVREKSRLLRYQRVAGLFEENMTLTPLGAWLPELESRNRGRYTQVCHLINRLTPDECRFEGRMEGNDYIFSFRGASLVFDALSDGYRAYIGWIVDLLYHICMGCPNGAKLVDNRGIVLVDEIDLHLHPDWQRTVIPGLSQHLPNLQFVVTSHSPIVAGTLESRNIFVMESDSSGSVDAKKYDERIHGLTAEQILESSYFGLTSTRDPDVIKNMVTLSKRVRQRDPQAALALLRQLSADTTTTDAEAAPSSRPKTSRSPSRKKKRKK